MTAFNDVRFGLLGGSIVDANALLARSYIWHSSVFPLVGFNFMAVHFWRIRKDGGHLRTSAGNARVGDESGQEERMNDERGTMN